MKDTNSTAEGEKLSFWISFFTVILVLFANGLAAGIASTGMNATLGPPLPQSMYMGGLGHLLFSMLAGGSVPFLFLIPAFLLRKKKYGKVILQTQVVLCILTVLIFLVALGMLTS